MIRDLRRDGLGRMGDLIQGDGPMNLLAQTLRFGTDRDVVDKTGLTASYHITMNFDMMALRRGPNTPAPPDAGPSVFTALQEQLGLRLEPAKRAVEMLVVDRIERPTPD